MSADYRQIYTKPYHPQTNGKVERIWRTIDNEFYKKKWLNSPEHREEELAKWIEKYNKYRVHLGIKGMTPYQKLLKIREADCEQRAKLPHAGGACADPFNASFQDSWR